MILGWAFFALALVALLILIARSGRTAGIKVIYRIESTSLMDGGEGRITTLFEGYVTTPESAFAFGRKIEPLHAAMHDGIASMQPEQ